jgi:hypothetical protein
MGTSEAQAERACEAMVAGYGCAAPRQKVGEAGVGRKKLAAFSSFKGCGDGKHCEDEHKDGESDFGFFFSHSGDGEYIFGDSEKKELLPLSSLRPLSPPVTAWNGYSSDSIPSELTDILSHLSQVFNQHPPHSVQYHNLKSRSTTDSQVPTSRPACGSTHSSLVHLQLSHACMLLPLCMQPTRRNGIHRFSLKHTHAHARTLTRKDRNIHTPQHIEILKHTYMHAQHAPRPRRSRREAAPKPEPEGMEIETKEEEWPEPKESVAVQRNTINRLAAQQGSRVQAPLKARAARVVAQTTTIPPTSSTGSTGSSAAKNTCYCFPVRIFSTCPRCGIYPCMW